MTKSQLQGNIFIFASTVLFALNIPIVKSITVSGVISPIGLTMLRFCFAALAFWIVSLFTVREKVPPRDLFMLFIGSLLGISVNQLLFIVGLSQTSPIDTSIILTVSPVVVMIISAIVLKEPVTFKKVSGVLLGASGALLIVLTTAGHSPGSVSSLSGNILVLVSVATYAGYLVMIKPFTQRYHTVTLMKWMFLFAVISVLPFCYQHVKIAPEAGFDAYLQIFYVICGATFIAYLLVPLGLKRLRPTTVSMYNYAQPLIASLVAILIGQDELTWEKPVSALLVFTGVYLVIRSKSRAQVLAEQEKVKETTNRGIS